MKLTKAQKSAIQKKPSNKQQYSAYLTLCAIWQSLDEVVDLLTPRARLIPYGLRDLKLAHRALDDLWRNMLHTFDGEKHTQLLKTGANMRIKTTFGPQVTPDPERVNIDIKDLATLVNAAYEKCMLEMCTPDKCHRCATGKVLDSVSSLTRGNRAWWEVVQGLIRAEEEANP